MESLIKLRAVGGSLVATIPKAVVEAEGFQVGQLVVLDVRRPKKSFFGITPGIGSFTREDRMEDRD